MPAGASVPTLTKIVSDSIKDEVHEGKDVGGSNADRGARQAHASGPSRQSGKQTAGNDPRLRRDRVDGRCGDDDRPKGLQDWTSSQPGLDWSLARTPRAAKTGSVRSPNRAIATYDACSSSVRSLSLGAHARGQTRILGSLPCWAGDRPRWSLWRSPTRWRASPGRYWPRATPIERRCTQAAERLRRAHKGLGKGNIGSRRERKGTSRVMMA